jgi:uncharacterized membrane protein
MPVTRFWLAKTINFSETLFVNILEKPGRIIFALGIIALAALQFIKGDYLIGRTPELLWPGWAANMPGKHIWAYISASILAIAGLAIILNKKPGLAAFVIGIMILVYSFLMRHLPSMIDLGNSYKSLALGSGAFIITASYYEKQGLGAGKFLRNRDLFLAGCIFLSLFLIYCGIAHFKFEEFISNGFIPDYIPVRSFWTYFTAIALIAGGIGLIFNATRKWAALLSGIMILLWFFLLHIPRTVAAPKDYSEWMGVFESFAFSGIFFTLAGICSERKFEINPGAGEGGTI